MDPAGAEVGKGLDDDDDEDEPAETAVCAFMANNLHKGSNRGSWKPLQQGWKKREKKEPRRVGDPPLSFGEFIRKIFGTLHGWAASSFWVHNPPPPPPPCPPGPLSYQGSIATGHTYGGAEGAQNFFSFPLPT